MKNKELESILNCKVPPIITQEFLESLSDEQIEALEDHLGIDYDFSDEEENKIGYVPILDWDERDKRKYCETPKHLGKGKIATAVLVVKGFDYPDGLVFPICQKCWKHFDDDMGSPQWNLAELREQRICQDKNSTNQTQKDNANTDKDKSKTD